VSPGTVRPPRPPSDATVRTLLAVASLRTAGVLVMKEMLKKKDDDEFGDR